MLAARQTQKDILRIKPDNQISTNTTSGELFYPAGVGRKDVPVLSRTKTGTTLKQVVWLGAATAVSAISSNCTPLAATLVSSFPKNADAVTTTGTGTGQVVTGAGFWEITTEGAFWVESTNLLQRVDSSGLPFGALVNPDIATAVANFALFSGLSGVNFANLARVSAILQAKSVFFNGVIPYPEYDNYLNSVAWEHGVSWGGAAFEIIGGPPVKILHSGNTTDAIATLVRRGVKTYRTDKMCGTPANGDKVVRTTTTATAAANDVVKEIAWEIRCESVLPAYEMENSLFCGIKEILKPGEFADFYEPGMELVLGYAHFVSGTATTNVAGAVLGDVVRFGDSLLPLTGVNPLSVGLQITGSGLVLDNTITGTMNPPTAFNVVNGKLTAALQPGDDFLIASQPMVVTRSGFNPKNVSSGSIANLFLEVD
jgi:hypothetical protein